MAREIPVDTTQSIIDQQQAMLALDRQAFAEARDRYQAQIHELRRAHELNCQATDRAIAARVLELDARERAVHEREGAVLAREQYIAGLEGLLDQLKMKPK